jgi:Tol biopolymer transport system component
MGALMRRVKGFMQRSSLYAWVLAAAYACGSDGAAPGAACEPGAGVRLTSLRGHLAFIANGQLGAVCPDGSDLRAALGAVVDTARIFHFDVSPDGTKMLVSYPQSSGNFDLLDVASGTTTAFSLPPSDPPQHYGATWSPDGGRIAYAIGFGDQIIIGDVVGASAANVRTLVNFDSLAPPAPQLGHLDWSPDGSSIASNEGTSAILAVDPTNGAVAHLDTRIGLVSQPAWSPDSRQLAFVMGADCCSPGVTSAVWLMNADASDPGGLVSSEFPSVLASPTWSPDGKQIVFIRGGDLWIMPATATGETPRELAHITRPGARQVQWVP